MKLGPFQSLNTTSLHFQGDKERTLSGEAASISPAICNNGSVNELDVIVDLLGVPSDLLTQRDLNRYSTIG